LVSTTNPEHPGDIVIQHLAPGDYVIHRVDGAEIGRCHDRLDAMRRACKAAEAAGANVWIHIEGTYREVVCP
jgi:hypothetical protein